jgi:hypothetical protein
VDLFARPGRGIAVVASATALVGCRGRGRWWSARSAGALIGVLHRSRDPGP